MAATVNRKYLPFRWLGADLTLNLANAPWLSKVIKIIGYTAPSSTGLNSQSGYLGGYNGTTPGGTLQKLVQNTDYLLIAGNTSGWSLNDAIEVFNITAGAATGITAMTNQEWFTTNVFTLHERAADIVFVAVDGIVQVPTGATGLGDYSLTVPSSGPQTVTVPVPTGATPQLYQVCYFPATGAGGYRTPGDVPVVSAGGAAASTRPWVKITKVQTTNNDVLFTVTSGNTSAGIKCSINGVDFGGVGQVSFPGQANGYYDSLTAELEDKSARDIWPLTVSLPSVGTTIRPTSAGTTAPPPTTTTPTTPAPTITSFSPGSAAVNAVVVLTGSHFTGATAVKVNGTAASAFTVDSDTQISFNVPAGATTGTLMVTTGGGSVSSSGSFTVTTAGSTGSTTVPTTSVTSVVVENNRITVTGSRANTSLNLRYSLDGITFQASPVFDNVTNGSYSKISVRLEDGSAVSTWLKTVVVNYTPGAVGAYSGITPQYASAVNMVFDTDGEGLIFGKKDPGVNTGHFDAYFYADHMIGNSGTVGLQGKFESDGQVLDNQMNTTVIGLNPTKVTDASLNVNALQHAIYFNAGEYGVLENGIFVYGPTKFPDGTGAAGFEIHAYDNTVKYILAYSGVDSVNHTLVIPVSGTRTPSFPLIPHVFITDLTTKAQKLKMTGLNLLSTPA